MRKYGIELNVVDDIAIVHRRCNEGHCHPSTATYDLVAATTAAAPGRNHRAAIF